MGGNFFVWQGTKRRKALCLSSICDAAQAEKGPPGWRSNVVNTASSSREPLPAGMGGDFRERNVMQ